MSKLNLNKPLTVMGKEATVIHQFNSGRVAVLVEGEQIVRTFAKNNAWAAASWRDVEDHCVELANKPTRTVKYVAFYPQTGSVYEQSHGPIKTSSYGLDQIIQVKLTYDGDQLIAKEIV